MAEVSETRQELALVSPSDIVFCDPGDDAVLSCHLEPAISAASMEIKWWNKTDLVCRYKNRQVTMNRHYEDQVRFSLQELHNGNVSLTLRDVQRSQRGIYICEVIHGHQTIKEYIFLHVCSQDFRLVVPTGPVCTDSGSDIILNAYLSPETNAVSMEIRWFKGTELIYQYKNGREMTNNDYKNRVSLSSEGLRRGNLTLLLRNVNQSDSGDYTCKLFHDRRQKTGVIHLQVTELQKHEHARESKHQAGELTFQKTPNYGGTYTEKRKYNVEESSTDTQILTHRFSERCMELLMRQEYHFREMERLSSGLITKRRRRNSIDGDRPFMSDGKLEKPEIEKRGPKDIVGRESGHQNTRRTREGNTATGQELSSLDTSSQVLRRLRTSESVTSVGKVSPVVEPTMLTPKSIQQKQTIFTRPILTRHPLPRPFLDSQSQVLLRPSKSLTANQSSLESTAKTTTTDLTKTKTDHI